MYLKYILVAQVAEISTSKHGKKICIVSVIYNLEQLDLFNLL